VLVVGRDRATYRLGPAGCGRDGIDRAVRRRIDRLRSRPAMEVRAIPLDTPRVLILPAFLEQGAPR